MERVAGIAAAVFAALLLVAIFADYAVPILSLAALGGLGYLGFYAWQYLERTRFASERAHRATPNSPPPPKHFDYLDHAKYREGLKTPEVKDMMKPSEASWLEHMLVVASSGHGKTQLLQWLAAEQLKLTRPPTLIILDSKGDKAEGIIQPLLKLSCFQERLKDKLLFIDPRTEPPALNMFDANPEEHNAVAVDLAYFLGALFEADTSATMEVAYLSLVSLMLSIKGANLDTLNEAVRDIKRFKTQIDAMPDRRMAKYLLGDFAKIIKPQTKDAVQRRIYGMTLKSPAMDTMFNAKTNILKNLSDDLDQGKIMLVNTDADFLGDLSPVFGRYIISRVITAALARKTRNPAFLIVDEAFDYTDQKTDQLLRTLRSYGLGVTLAYQSFFDLTPALQRSAITNTSVKYVGGGDRDAANFFAKHLNTTPEFIFEQGKDGHEPPTFTRFALHIRNKMQTAQSVTLPIPSVHDTM